MNKEKIYKYVKEKYKEYGEHINDVSDLWTSYMFPVIKTALEFGKEHPGINLTVVEYASLLHNIASLEDFFKKNNMDLQGRNEICAKRAADLITDELPKEMVLKVMDCIRDYGKEFERAEIYDENRCLTDAIAVVNFEKMYELLSWRKQISNKHTNAIKSEIDKLTESYFSMSASIKELYQKRYEEYISILNAKLSAINEELLGSIVSGYTGIVMQEGGCN